jgi:hypothetical protein
MRDFLFGTGWWTLWHVFVLALLLPFAGLIWWLLIVKPGAGPQGGEFAAGLLLLFFLGWTLISFVHVMLYAGLQPGGWGRFLKGGGVWLVGWWVIGWGIYKLSDLAASPDAGLAARRAGLAGLVALVLSLYVVNLILLARVRAS